MDVGDLLVRVYQIARAIEGEIGAVDTLKRKDYLVAAAWGGQACESPVLCVRAIDLLQLKRGLGTGRVACSRAGVWNWIWCGWGGSVGRAFPVVELQGNALGASRAPDIVNSAGCTAGLWTALACCLLVAAAEATAVPAFRTPTRTTTLGVDWGAAIPLAVLVRGATPV